MQAANKKAAAYAPRMEASVHQAKNALATTKADAENAIASASKKQKEAVTEQCEAKIQEAENNVIAQEKLLAMAQDSKDEKLAEAHGIVLIDGCEYCLFPRILCSSRLISGSITGKPECISV